MSTVAGRILDLLAEHGASTVFGLPGVHNLAFWRAPSDVRLVGVRHEQAAGYAADGWARATGGLGAAVVTTGPGAANALAAFGEAAASHSPVLLVASEVPSALQRDGEVRGLLHESPDQAALFAPLAKAVFTPRTADDAMIAAAEAVGLALRPPRGPVYLDVPVDVLGLDADEPPPVRIGRPALDRVAVSAAATALREAGRVVLWVGGGAVDAADAVARLATRLGAPVVQTPGGRGCPPTDHPLTVGVAPHEPEVAELIASADLLLGIGTDFDGHTTRHWSMPRPPRLVTVNADARELALNYAPDVGVIGDSADAAEALLAELPGADRPPWAPPGLRAAVLDRLRADPATTEAAALLDAVRRGAPDAVLVCDMAIAGYWVGSYAAVERTRALQYPVGWGTLGYGFPAALGAAAAGHPTLAVCGDGGLAMGLGELATLVQERLPLTVLVVDDGGYGMLRYDQQRAGDPLRGVDLVTPDFPALAAAFGLPATDVPAIGPALADALGAALASRAPQLIRVPARLLPPRTTSPRWHDG